MLVNFGYHFIVLDSKQLSRLIFSLMKFFFLIKEVKTNLVTLLSEKLE